MPAFIIVQVDVTDPEAFATYRDQVPPTLEPFGGEYMVRGGEQDVLEGDWAAARTVVLKFPSVERAKAWHASDIYTKDQRRSVNRQQKPTCSSSRDCEDVSALRHRRPCQQP